jgi:2-phospho-L-lactate/phosphoenolpyruvate guanylyltransferase
MTLDPGTSLHPGATAAIVPLRTDGKTRLSSVLDAEQRACLAEAMLSDVVGALVGAGIQRVLVAAEGHRAIAAAEHLGLEAVADEPGTGGLDAALRNARPRVAGTSSLLVVAADLPRLTAAEVRSLLARHAPVVVAPTHDGGTGGLLRRPPDVIGTAYGRGSAQRHLDLAHAVGLPAEIVHAEGFARDVDTDDDLAALRVGVAGPATTRLLDTLSPSGRAAG